MEAQFIEVVVPYVTRSIVLIATTLAGIMCIFLAWKLYSDSAISQRYTKKKNGPSVERDEIEVAHDNTHIKLSSSQPGLAFLVLGVAMLVFGISNRLESSGCPEYQGLQQESGINYENSKFESMAAVMHVANNERPEERRSRLEEPKECNCLYRSRRWKMSFFEGGAASENEERQMITESLDAAITIVGLEVKKNPRNGKLQRNYLVLKELRDGFSSPE